MLRFPHPLAFCPRLSKTVLKSTQSSLSFPSNHSRVVSAISWAGYQPPVRAASNTWCTCEWQLTLFDISESNNMVTITADWSLLRWSTTFKWWRPQKSSLGLWGGRECRNSKLTARYGQNINFWPKPVRAHFDDHTHTVYHPICTVGFSYFASLSARTKWKGLLNLKQRWGLFFSSSTRIITMKNINW